MQTAEKLTFTFVFKLAALSVLLFIGFLVKPSKVLKHKDAANMTEFVVPATAAESDTIEIKPPYRLVKYRPSSTSSI